MKLFWVLFCFFSGASSLCAQLLDPPLLPIPPSRQPVQICLYASSGGCEYRLMRNNTLVASLPGTGSALCFSGPFSGTYRIDLFSGGMTYVLADDIVIDAPLKCTLTTSSSAYQPGATQWFELDCSRPGLLYDLQRNGRTVQSLPGTGGALRFEGSFGGGHYTVSFRSDPGSALSAWWYSGTLSVSADVSAAGVYPFTCSSERVFPGLLVEFRLGGSVPGTQYTLLRENRPVSTQPGTGDRLVFRDTFPAGAYRLKAVSPGGTFYMEEEVVLQDYEIIHVAYIFPEVSGLGLSPDGWVCEFSYTPVSPAAAHPFLWQLAEIADAYNSGRILDWDPAFRVDVATGYSLRITVPLNLSSSPRSGLFTLANRRDYPRDYASKCIHISQQGGGVLKNCSIEAPFSVEPERSYTVTLNGIQVGVSYTLYRDGAIVGTQEGRGRPLLFPVLSGCGTYRVVAAYGELSVPVPHTATVHPAGSLPNYIHTQTFNDLDGSVADVSFFDGLGRPVQQVGLNASPGGGDLVTPVHYDLRGRADARTYLPYVRERGFSAWDVSAFASQQAFYTTHHPGEGACAFQANEYASSLPDRLLGTVQPGKTVRERNKKAAYGYRFNTGDSVRRLRAAPDGSLTSDGCYPKNTLFQTSVTDEDGTRTEIFTDQWGNTVLERVLFSADGQQKQLDTYRVYNREGFLAYVISPEGSVRLPQQGVVLPSDAVLEQYAYRYEYDALGRLTLRRLPGAGEEYFVYDPDDRPVLYQDSRFRASGQWKLSEYDAFGRLVCERLFSDPRDRGVLAALFHTGAGNSLYGAPGDVLAEYGYDSYPADAPSPLPSDLLPATLRLVSSLPSGAASGTLLHSSAPIPDTLIPPDLVLTDVVESRPGSVVSYNPSPRSLKTWERLALVDEGYSGYLERFYYYDVKSRLIQVQEKHDGGQISYTSYKYDFVGNVLEVCERQQNGSGSSDLLHTVNRYDNRNRLLSSRTTLNNEAAAEVGYMYDELGRLASRTYGDGACTEELSYDIQGKLLSQANPHFSMSLRYDLPVLPGSIPSYTGNITEWEWWQGNSDLRTYAFSYDGVSRLQRAWSYTGGVRDFRFEERDLAYDANGNILSLSRTDQSAQVVDDLHYSYTGNRLTALEERVGDLGAADLYAPLGQVSGSYQYDGNGNMTHDSRRGLQLSYNSLHLFSSVRDAGGGVRAVYGYSSDGVKRSVRGADGSGYEYRGSMIYRRSGSSLILESAGFSGGRIHAAGSGYEVCYFLTDHLGNVRVVLDGEGNVRERNDYYPFGTRHRRGDYPSLAENRFKFGGKEEQNTGDLGYLDFIARPYDPLLGKWFMMDPLGEKYYPFSPYAYALNNPINLIDPDGQQVDWYQNNETQYYTWFYDDKERDGFTHVGKKGSLLGEFELMIDGILTKGFNTGSLYSEGFTFDIAPNDKGAMIGSKERDWDFLDEFVTGTGSEFSVLLSNHPYTEAMKTDKDVSKAQQKIVDGDTDVPGQITNYRVGWGLWDVITTPSMAKQFIGSYRYDAFTSADGQNLNNVISDSKSRSSFFYHLVPERGNKRREQAQDFANTYQFYIWQSLKK